MKTIWNNNIQNFDKLNKNISCDTAIIGGGIAGLWCAYNLAKQGQKVCVLEAKTIGSGTTGGSSAILTYGQEILYNTLIKKHGTEVARQHLQNTKNAIRQIKNIIETENINCNLEQTDFTLFSTKFLGTRSLKKEQRALRQLGTETSFINLNQLPYKTKKALLIKDTLLLDPLMLLKGLVDVVVQNGGQIYENTMVKSQPKNNKIKVDGFEVSANNFIVASHFPYINFPGFYFLKMYQSQNYSIVFKPNNNQEAFAKNITYECIDKNGFEYRRVGNNILCLGPDIRTGSKPYKSKYQIVKKHLEKHFPNHTEITRFSAQDCITADQLPYAGNYSNFLDNVFVLSGFNKWGITNSCITAKVVCDMVLKAKTDTQNIYAPDRNNFFASIIETTKNVGVDIAGLFNNILNLDTKKLSRIKNNQGAMVKLNGKRVGAYKDESGQLHMISGICPHMGCSLKWNKDETTFDCPCHGSRFDIEGKVLNNPSIANAEKIHCCQNKCKKQ